MDGYIGELKCFAGTFPPQNWQFCQGQILPISEFEALFSIIGAQFGGDGRANFALPDLRGRAPIGPGTAPGLLFNRIQGQKGGTESVTLQVGQMPQHNHSITNTSSTQTSGLTVGGSATIKCNNSPGSSQNPSGNFPAATSRGGDTIYSNSSLDSMAPGAVGLNLNVQGNVDVTVQSTCADTGGGQAHENMPPWACINFIICVNGIYPDRPS